MATLSPLRGDKCQKDIRRCQCYKTKYVTVTVTNLENIDKISDNNTLTHKENYFKLFLPSAIDVRML